MTGPKLLRFRPGNLTLINFIENKRVGWTDSLISFKLRVSNLSKHFGEYPIFENFDLRLPCNGFIVLIGPSGCGKSILFNVLTGVVAKDSGAISWCGESIFHLRDRSAYMQQKVDRSPETLSGGEKRLVSIASILCLSPSVLVLEEPCSNLDWKGIQRVRNLLLQIHSSGGNIVVIEQRLGRFLQDATHCLVVEQGKIRFEGSADNAYRIMLNEHLVPHYPRKLRQNKLTGNNTILAVKDLSCVIKGRSILKKISLEFKRNETVVIVGENGAGKTTLIKHFNGLLKPLKGEVLNGLTELKESIGFLSRHRMGRLIPEVRSNLGYALAGAARHDEVAAFPGRISQI